MSCCICHKEAEYYLIGLASERYPLCEYCMKMSQLGMIRIRSGSDLFIKIVDMDEIFEEGVYGGQTAFE